MTKKPNTSEILAGINNEKDALERRVAELEKQLAEFQTREKAIADAITFAITKRESIIVEAEARANSIIDTAKTEAEAIVATAEAEALRIKTETDAIVAEKLKSTEEQITAMLAEAKERASASDADITRINSGVVQLAVPLFEQIVKYRSYYEELTGVKLSLPTDAKPQPSGRPKVSRHTSDSANPADVYHTIRRITDDAQRVDISGESAYTEPEELTDDIIDSELGGDDLDTAVQDVTEGVISAACAGDVVNMNAAYESADWLSEDSLDETADLLGIEGQSTEAAQSQAELERKKKAVDDMFSRVFGTGKENEPVPEEVLSSIPSADEVPVDLGVDDESIKAILDDILGDIDI